MRSIRTEQNGYVEYRLDGVLHRACGPAVLWYCGDAYWWLFNVKHRYYGPRDNGDNGYQWVIHDKRIK